MKVKLKNLSKNFENNRSILKNINFNEEVHSLAIIGPSGGGKSTLLKIIGGLISPTIGEVEIDENKLSFSESELFKYRKSIGFIFQQDGLFKHMTVLENIIIPLIHVHGYSEEKAKKIALSLLKRFGLEKEINKKPFELSGGQKQRVGIARALAPKPKFLLFDEPTSALDPEYTVEVLDIIKELKDEGIDFIIVTHEMGFARHACDKVCFLYDGDILEYGDSSEIFTNPSSKELQNFLGKLLEWNI
ncbi:MULTISPECIES: amino acid ABC transporter ATP-binding protein [Fusobacterium]|uniref:amino acid ABC transporter ATP-binding protein n=1 Tax=Fusobacterium TaxID=848 RepID=UPI00147707E7|nr:MULTISPECIES: amino acid ABC transporter ATP-binding protein [Fusobacterium]NME36238.1 amino acid ABC transporter ATP-binding protein [Fusobacterium sp. FSA-380-WT-3A]